MKYEFIKIDEDTTKLKYKDKEFDIKRDIDLQVKVQESIKKSKILMAKDLSSMGMTRKDLVIETKQGNKTIYDNTNAIEIDKEYQRQATEDVFNDLTRKYTNMTLAELMLDIGIDLEDGVASEKFGIELTAAFMGEKLESPSQED